MAGRSVSAGGFGRWQPLALALLSALAGSVFEEVIFRGFLFRLIAGLGGKWTALGVTLHCSAWRTFATPEPLGRAP